MLTDEQIAAYLQVGNESRAVEFKGNRETRAPAYIAKVARAAMAMSNQRDGGHVLLGVDDHDPMGPANGLTEEEVALWGNLDWVADKINRYADPPLELRVEERLHPNRNRLIIIEVSEFAEIPTLCKSNSTENILMIGMMYTRSLRKPESTQYHTQNEVRELLSLATAKGLRQYMTTARDAGVSFEPDENSRELYEREIESVLHQDESAPLVAQPHFRLIIHPRSYVADQIPYRDLVPAVNSSTVRLKGWPFPYVGEPRNAERFVYEMGDRENRNAEEGWALFQSGLFISTRQIGTWPEDDDGHYPETLLVTGNMPIWLPLVNFTEALEFATRLRRFIELEEPLTVRFEGHNLKGQRLVVANSRRGGFHSNYIYSDKKWHSAEYTIDDATEVSGTRHLAVEASLELIARFGWAGVTAEMLQAMQREAFDRA